MMTIKKYQYMKFKIIILGIALLGFSSCNKWLDVDLINQVDENKLFAKEQGFNDALAGVYNQLSGQNLYGERLSFEFMDVLAQYYNYNSIAEEYKRTRDYNYKDATVRSQIDGIWSGLYSGISGVNNILKWEQKNGDVMRPNVRKQVLGESMALRAYLHFDLLRMFCEDIKFNHNAKGIAYNKQFGVSLPPMYTAAECYQLVLQDLKDAYTNLDQVDPINEVIPYTLPNKNQADKDVARMNKYAVKALMARVYLTLGDKANALKCAKEVIESKKFRLLDYETGIDVEEAKKDILFSDEHIFSLRNKDIPDWSKALHFEVRTNTGTASAKLLFSDAYQIYGSNADDARYEHWSDVEMTKYYSRGDVKAFFPKIPMIKLSEMYLIAAECLYDTDLNGCLTYINTLRKSRIRNAADWFYITRDNIFEEMMREYAGEGQLFYAYKRLNRGIKNNSGTMNIEPSNSIFVFPIPDKEIETGHRN
ncbi:RagB/SusD family nutrient uptake outer membrane protein [Pedobacter nyackensis]|uniref:RagB/SusD family nutrient uptake outer membrane protein n=1 Tax=Pedobacter nyackensis TaxID=475255 RepID=UPI002930BBD6|nr:RagB/SusD family nutrient uptake outer membrane protein [Pedobacter nyackensis]